MTEKLNRPLIEAVLAQIVSDPESHDQDLWIKEGPADDAGCGTTCCVAGWAVTLTPGYEPLGYASARGVRSSAYWVRTPDGREERIEVVAQRLLGLSEQAAYTLFIRTSTEDVPEALKDLLNGGDDALFSETVE